MNGTKYLKGECSLCGGRIEFPAEATGTTADCPHCGQSTELLLAMPKEEPTLPRGMVLWTLVAVLVLVVGFGLALVALKRAQRWADRRKQATVAQVAAAPAEAAQKTVAPDPDDPVTKAGFSLSEIKLQKAKEGSLIYALGTLTNTTARARYGVRLEFDLFDAEGKKIGKASDYQPQMIEANDRWEFKALLSEGRTASVKVTMATEQP